MWYFCSSTLVYPSTFFSMWILWIQCGFFSNPARNKENIVSVSESENEKAYSICTELVSLVCNCIGEGEPPLFMAYTLMLYFMLVGGVCVGYIKWVALSGQSDSHLCLHQAELLSDAQHCLPFKTGFRNQTLARGCWTHSRILSPLGWLCLLNAFL